MDNNETLIQITNYHSIQKAKINVRDGITAIIGKTNAGKSSIMRALNDLIENGCGDSDIRIGTDVCTIAVRNNGNTIKLVRDKNATMKTKYIVNGDEISKVGRNKLDETDLLGLSGTETYNLNIIKQEDLPFLVYENNYKIYEFLSQSKSKTLLNAKNNLKENKKGLSKDIKRVEAEINEIKSQHSELVDESKKYPKIAEVKSYKDKYQKLNSLIEEIQSHKDSMEVAVKAFKEKEEEIKKLDNRIERLEGVIKLPISKDIGKYKNMIEKHKEIEDRIKEVDLKIKGIKTLGIDFNNILKLFDDVNNIHKLKNKYEESKEKLEEIKSNMVDLIPELDVDTQPLVLVNKLKELKIKYDESKGNILSLNRYIEIADIKIDEAEKELSKYSVCPTCGQPIENCKD